MNKILIAAFVLGFSLLGFAETPDEAAVRAAHDAYLKAAQAGDAAALKELLADDVVYSHSNTSVQTKQQAIDALVKSPNRYEMHSQTIHVYGTAATLRGKVTAHGAAGDTPMTMLQVWVKTGGKWRMIERQTTRIPAAQ